MRTYLELVDYVLACGQSRPSRVGPVQSVFGIGLSVSMHQSTFPLITTRKVNYGAVFGELAAFLRGAEYLDEFKSLGCNYWDENAKAWEQGGGKWLGRIYGVQWRAWKSPHLEEPIDQIDNLIQGLRDDPYGRRHIITAWNPGEMHLMCLPPCHVMAQFYVEDENTLSCQVYMRSVDLMLGLPSDLVLYGALLILVARAVGRAPGDLKYSFGDAHIYENHVEQAKEQLARRPLPPPKYEIPPWSNTSNFLPKHLEILGYEAHPYIAYKLNV